MRAPRGGAAVALTAPRGHDIALSCGHRLCLHRDGYSRWPRAPQREVDLRSVGQEEIAMLAKLLSRYWWMTLLRGVLWILFGIIVLTRPGISLAALTFTFGVFALAD